MKKLLLLLPLFLLLAACSPVQTGWLSLAEGTCYADGAGNPLTGLQEIDGRTYFFGEDGYLRTGWQEGRHFGPDGAMSTGPLTLEDQTYYLLEDGTPFTGWLNRDGQLYFYGPDGVMRIGWQEVEGALRHFGPNGALSTGRTAIDGREFLFDTAGLPIAGWQSAGGSRFYTLPDGAIVTGWQEIGGETFLFLEDGTLATGQVTLPEGIWRFDEDGHPVTGWLQEADGLRHFGPDGRMAVGPVEIDGRTHHFSPHGVQLLLVNPWNYLPGDYSTPIQVVEGYPVSANCAGALMQMLSACRAAGFKPVVVSGYRTQADQEGLFANKVSRVMALGYGREEATVIAATEVARPGTSEHQLGLAVDIVDSANWSLDESQADMPTQKWLMEHCWEYGFILRYPVGTTDQTGIIYEPWHYRYVGTDISLELRDLGITLEEYLQATPAQ